MRATLKRFHIFNVGQNDAGKSLLIFSGAAVTPAVEPIISN